MRNETLWIYLDVFFEKRAGNKLHAMTHVENVTPNLFPNLHANGASAESRTEWDWDERTAKVYNLVKEK